MLADVHLAVKMILRRLRRMGHKALHFIGAAGLKYWRQERAGEDDDLGKGRGTTSNR